MALEGGLSCVARNAMANRNSQTRAGSERDALEQLLAHLAGELILSRNPWSDETEAGHQGSAASRRNRSFVSAIDPSPTETQNWARSSTSSSRETWS